MKKILCAMLALTLALTMNIGIANSYETDVSFSWTKNLPIDDVIGYKLYKQDRITGTYNVIAGHDSILDSTLNVTDTFVDDNGVTREKVKYSMSYETDGYPDNFILIAYNDISSSDYSDTASNDPLPPATDNVLVKKEFQHVNVEFIYQDFDIDINKFKLYADDATVCETQQWESVEGKSNTYTIVCDYTFTQFPVSFVLGAIDNNGGEAKSEPYVFTQDSIIIEAPKSFKVSFEGTLIVTPLPDPEDDNSSSGPEF
jgi:hypothetical protein